MSTKSTASIFLSKTGEALIRELVKPTLYGFSCSQLDEENFLKAVKLGDTRRSSVAPRIQEWKNLGGIYSDLKLEYTYPAFFTSSSGKPVYFRDYAVHSKLESWGWRKLIFKENLNFCGASRISQEFYYQEAAPLTKLSQSIVEKAVESLKKDYENGVNSRFFYDSNAGGRESTQYLPVNDFQLREFQEQFKNEFVSYVLKNLNVENSLKFLLTAPTRSGKSHMAIAATLELFKKHKETAGQAHHTALIVSGFAEVEDEWKKTIQSHKSFNQKEISEAEDNRCGESPCVCKSTAVYLSKEDLLKDSNAVDKAFSQGAENVFVFLTLQDLAGSTTGRKGEHFNAHDWLKTQGAVDAILADEAHFAAFNKDGVYSSSINPFSEDRDKFEKNSGQVSDEVVGEASKVFSSIQPNLVRLFITATPLNVLLEGSFFDVGVNTFIVTEEEIACEKEEWDRLHLSDEVEEEVTEKASSRKLHEWDNPCFGIPKKYSFAMSLGLSSNELFAPVDSKDGSKGFKKQELVESFIEGIFSGESTVEGAKIPRIFNDPVLKNAGLGENVLLSLPRCASVDAFEEVLSNVLRKNGLDNDYEILNVSSLDKKKQFTRMSAAEIRRYIMSCEKKTITLTVDRLTTGVTVEKWDSVLILRNISSAQKFIQLAGRSGTPWVSTVKNSDGDFFKLVEKQSCAILSFDPDQVLQVQWDAAVSFASRDTSGEVDNSKVEEYLDESLKVSPVFLYDGTKFSMRKVTRSNLLEIIQEEDRKRGARELAERIPADVDRIVENSEALTLFSSFSGVKASTKIDVDAFNDKSDNSSSSFCIAKGCSNKVEKDGLCSHHLENTEEMKKDGGTKTTDTADRDSKKDEEKFRKKLEESVKTVYSGAILLSVLLEDRVKSYSHLIELVEENTEARKISEHLGISVELLKAVKSISRNSTIASLSQSIFTAQKSFEAEYTDSWRKFEILLNSMKRFSANEIPTPRSVAQLLLDKLSLSSEDYVSFESSGVGLIDNGCKSAVVLVEFLKRAVEAGCSEEIVRSKLYAVPTSGITFELVKKVFKAYNIPVENILYSDSLSCLELNELLKLLFLKKKEGLSVDELRKEGFKNLEKLEDKIQELFDKISEEDSLSERLSHMEKFDYCVSNPPYQQDNQTGEKRSTTEIFPLFQKTGSAIANITSMIYPATWQRDLSKGLGKFLLENGLKESNSYSGQKIFATVILPVSIVLTENAYQDVVYCNGREVSRDASVWIDSQQSAILEKITRLLPKLNLSLTTVSESNAEESSLNLEEELTEKALSDNDVRIMLKKKPGKQADSRWFRASREEFCKLHPNFPLDSYKVAVRDRILGRQAIFVEVVFTRKGGNGLETTVFNPGEAHGLTWVTLKNFPNREEAENFSLYLNSMQIAYLAYIDYSRKSFGSFIPDLKDYSNKNEIFTPDEELGEDHEYYGLSLEERLYKYFKLTPEEIAILKKTT